MTLLKAQIKDRRETWILFFIHVLGLAFLFLIAMLVLGVEGLQDQDVALYYKYSTNIAEGKLPYREFSLEYPPLGLVPMVLPHLITLGVPITYFTYVCLFAFQNLVYSLIIMIILMGITKHAQPARAVSPIMAAYTQIIIVQAPSLFWHYDILPVLLSVAGLYAVLARRSAFAGVMMGLSIAAKLYAIVLLPVFFIYYIVSKETRAMCWFFCGCILSLGFAFPPFLLIDSSGLLASFAYHHSRGLQLESFPAGVLSLLHTAGMLDVLVEYKYGAWHISSPLSHMVVNIISISFLGVWAVTLTCCYLVFRKQYRLHGAVSLQSLIAYLVMALLALLMFSKVFSPQFILWLLPFGVLLSRNQARALLLISLATAVLLSRLIYMPLISQDLYAVLLLNMRNALVMLLFLWLLRAYHMPMGYDK